MNKKCERCGTRVPGYKLTDESDDGIDGPKEFFDYCALCSRDLCDECMAEGCCGNIPAKSGAKADFGDSPVGK